MIHLRRIGVRTRLALAILFAAATAVSGEKSTIQPAGASLPEQPRAIPSIRVPSYIHLNPASSRRSDDLHTPRSPGVTVVTCDVTIAPGTSPGGGYIPLSSFGVEPVAGITDDSVTTFNTPPFIFAGETYTTIGFSSNGYAIVGSSDPSDNSLFNQSFPNPNRPNNILAPFWTDLNPEVAGALRIATLTDGVDSWVVLDWETVREFSTPNSNSFQIWIGIEGDPHPDEDITFAYGTIEGSGNGGFLTVGAENRRGDRGQNFWFNGAGTLPMLGTQLRVSTTSCVACDVMIATGASPAGYLPLSLFGVTSLPGITDDSVTNFDVSPFTFAGDTYTVIGISSNGYAIVGGSTGPEDNRFTNQSFPDAARPNNVLAPFWTDLNPESAGALRIGTLTDGANSWIVLDWEAVTEFHTANSNSFQIWIGITGNTTAEDITFTYGTIEGSGDDGHLTVGAENKRGDHGDNEYFDGAGTLPTSSTQLRVTATNCLKTQAINLSTRMRILTGDGIGIGGFIITGSTSKHVLLRAIGPSLSALGIPDALPDPALELHGPGGFTTIVNDNWRDNQEAAIQATGIPPSNDLESAIDAMLSPGAYTALMSGNGSTTGVGLIEIYDLDQAAPSRAANLSTRAFVDTGDSIVIGGFLLSNEGNVDRVIVRGLGPSLGTVGVPNALADPALELRDGNGMVLVANDDWQDDPAQVTLINAEGLGPSDNLESAIAATLPPGPYTVLLSGVNNGTGNCLVEVYDLGP